MTTNRTRLIISVMIMSAAVLWGCKPTEKGYQQAYDAAKARREAAAREQMLPAGGLQSDDGPQLRVMDGDSIYVLRERLRTEDSRPAPYPWLLAVGVYRMNTNAGANAENLRSEGYADATFLRGPEDKWYTIAQGASTLDSLIIMNRSFRKKHRDYPYVGLPAAPVIVNAR